jgi:tripartite-type tricarboxylate transporter receptor subunit TctC
MPSRHGKPEKLCIGHQTDAGECCAKHPPEHAKEDDMKRACLMLLPVLGLACASMEAGAQSWPTRPIRAIVPFTAGSGTDIISRVVFDQLSIQLGQPIVVENKGGAGATIGAAFVAKSDPDGYTMLAPSSALTIAPALHPNLGYDTARDLAAVIPFGSSPNVLVVSPSKGFKTVHELVAAAKAKPGSFNLASNGVGTNTHLSAERFRLSAGLEATHVPFRGGPEALTEVIAGRADLFIGPIAIVLPHIRQGTLLALAVNSLTRAPALPDVPTLLEAGFRDADCPPWFGLFVPAKTPRDIVDKLHRETVKALQAPKVQEKLATLGVEPMVMTPVEFDAYIKKELSVNAALLTPTGVKAD